MDYTDLSCIRCGKKFTPSGPPGPDTPPNDGLLFITYGNYGSTVYDPCDPFGQEYLCVALCDACVVAQAAEQNVLHICKPLPQQPPPPRYRGPWKPDASPKAAELCRTASGRRCACVTGGSVVNRPLVAG
jgi:hypothetical protein